MFAIAVLAILVPAFQLAAPATPATDSEVSGLFPKAVRGHVTDLLGYPIEGANVTVVVKSGAIVRATLWYDSTEPDGYYLVTFEGNQWDEGNIIEVTARYGSETAQNSTVADSQPYQNVDVRFSFAIPEFGQMLPFVTVGSVAVLVVFRRRSG